MRRGTLNLGILAHVDAGKTTLTERLLYAAGVIDRVGRVDDGTTQTDSLALERQRGITIKSAVVSFDTAGARVNLIDTPGHPDFIAEVERALDLLDGAVLVISAVEGVQPQTRVLMRALRRLRVPTVMFVNKVDRLGADVWRVLAAIRGRLTGGAIPMGTVHRIGTRAARFTAYGFGDPDFRAALTEELAQRSDALLTAYVENERGITGQRLRDELATQTRRSLVHPVFFGSANTGDGVGALMTGLTELLLATVGDVDAATSARVFKVGRGPAGEKVAYVRMFTGAVHTRQRVPVHGVQGGRTVAKPTAIRVSDQGRWVRRDALDAGEIGQLWGLGDVRIGDMLGESAPTRRSWRFPPPTMQTTVTAVRARDDGALRSALSRLAEEDPLINVRVDDTGREISVSLYGEVQKEVIQATLATEFGIDATFHDTTTICVERPTGVGEAVEFLNTDTNPFQATIGLRVEPGPPNSGITFRLDVEPQAVPMYVYQSAGAFSQHMGGYVRRTLREGRFGWQVTDCAVTMINCGYSVADGPPARRGPTSSAADFRHLTPMVLMRALDRAATVVCEPTLRVNIEAPVGAIGAMSILLGRLGAAVHGQTVRGELTVIETVLPATGLQRLRRQLPELTGGEGVIESTFEGYRPVVGEPPVRPRSGADPLEVKEYLLSLTREGARG